MSQSEYQSKFTGPPLAMGSLYTTRIFEADGPTLFGSWGQPWTDGENNALCLRPEQLRKSVSLDFDLDDVINDTSISMINDLAKQEARAMVAEHYFGEINATTLEYAEQIARYGSHAAVWRQRFSDYSNVNPVITYTGIVYEQDGHVSFMRRLNIDLTVLAMTPHDSFKDCSCGFYGSFKVDRWFGGRLAYDSTFAAVVEQYGETLVGTLGARSMKARIIGLAPLHERARMKHSAFIEANYPSAVVYHGVRELMDAHSLTLQPSSGYTF